MSPISFPERYRAEFSKLDWIVNLARRETQILEPLGDWFRQGNYDISDVPPGLRNEVFFKDLKTGISHPTSLWKEWGYNTDQMNGEAWLNAIHPEDRAELSTTFTDYRNGKDVRNNQAVYRVCDARGNYHWILSSTTQIRRSSIGELYQYVGRDVEIGTRIEKEAALRRHAKYAEDKALRDRALVEAAGEIAGVFDAASLLSAVNRTARSIMYLDDFRLISVGSRHSLTLLGNPLPDWLIDSKMHKLVGHSSHQIFSDSNHTQRFAVWPLGEILDGKALAVFRVLEKFDCKTARLMGFLAPLILRAWQQVERLTELQRYATTDPLTGIWNRRAFIQQASTALRNNIETKNSSTVVMLDIDHFKLVNDRFGHDFGDQVLKQVAIGLSETLRAGDLLCRWGGEEFAVFLKDIDVESAGGIVERIRQRGSKKSELNNCRVTLSAGFHSISPYKPQSLDNAVSCADAALFRAKRNGRNRSLRYDDSDDILLR